MRRSNRGIGEGVAFTALIISASAMDSDSRVLPVIILICAGAVLALFRMRVPSVQTVKHFMFRKTRGKGGEGHMGYRICPYCGASLDPDERCDCRDAAQEKENEPAGGGRTDSK